MPLSRCRAFSGGLLVEGATDVIYKTLEMTGLKHDEGPDIGGEYGPYVQSERMGMYMDRFKNIFPRVFGKPASAHSGADFAAFLRQFQHTLQPDFFETA